MCRSMAKLAGWGKERGEQFLRTPVEVDNSRQWRQRVQEDRKGHFLGGVGARLLPFPPLSD